MTVQPIDRSGEEYVIAANAAIQDAACKLPCRPGMKGKELIDHVVQALATMAKNAEGAQLRAIERHIKRFQELDHAALAVGAVAAEVHGSKQKSDFSKLVQLLEEPVSQNPHLACNQFMKTLKELQRFSYEDIAEALCHESNPQHPLATAYQRIPQLLDVARSNYRTLDAQWQRFEAKVVAAREQFEPIGLPIELVGITGQYLPDPEYTRTQVTLAQSFAGTAQADALAKVDAERTKGLLEDEEVAACFASTIEAIVRGQVPIIENSMAARMKIAPVALDRGIPANSSLETLSKIFDFLQTHCPHVRKLDLTSQSNLTSDLLKKLKDFTSLTTLRLGSSPRLDADLLEALPSSLQELSLNNCSGAYSLEAKWHLFPNLAAISFTSCDISHTTLQNLPASIKTIAINSCRGISEKVVGYFTKSPEERANTQAVSTTNLDDLQAFKGNWHLFPNIETIQFDSLSFQKDKDMVVIADLFEGMLPSLKVLRFSRCSGVNEFKDKWHLFPNLASVSFDGSDITDETVRGLPPSVRILSFRDCSQLTDGAIALLPGGVKNLILSGNERFTDVIWKMLGTRCPYLERLIIGDDWYEGEHDNFVGKGMEFLPQTMNFIELYSGLARGVSATHIHRFKRTHPHARVSYEGGNRQLSPSEKADVDQEDRMSERREQVSVSVKGPTGSEPELLQTKLRALLQEIPEVSLHHLALQKAIQEYFDVPSKAKLGVLRTQVIQVRKDLPHLLSQDELTVLNRLMQILLKKPSEGGSLTQAMKRLSINNDNTMQS